MKKGRKIKKDPAYRERVAQKTQAEKEQIRLLREKDRKVLVAMLETRGKTAVLGEYACFLDKRRFFSVDFEGNIHRKGQNFLFPIFSFFEDPELLTDALLELADPREKIRVSKIDRRAELPAEVAAENFLKTMVRGESVFALSFGKELFLKDQTLFFRLAARFALAGNIRSLKPLWVLAFEPFAEKITGNGDFDDPVFYAFLSYLTKYRDDFYDPKNLPALWEKDGGRFLSPSELVTILAEDGALSVRERLELGCYLRLLEKKDFGEEKYLRILNYEYARLRERKGQAARDPDDPWESLLLR
ncbi:MAG: hypothetical protein LBQ96_02665, partial [Fusobacteriaceae bacterium]|nr:hypothetical protein [Fusobacteriaceae bacterium]